MDLTRTSPPHILLVEDDPISRDVLALALRDMPARVHPVASLAEAREAISSAVFDVWLVDAHLPDGHGRELLALRPASTSALAHTAATDAGVHECLLQAGFAEVLVKPIAAARIQAAVRRVLRGARVEHVEPADTTGATDHPVWNDALALQALAGNAQHVRALRGLFVGELVAELDALGSARALGDADTVRARVHRLRASCGFVGAARIGAQLARLEATPLDGAVFELLRDAMRETAVTPDPLASEADALAGTQRDTAALAAPT